MYLFEGGTCHGAHVEAGEQFWSQFSLLPMWVLRTELRSSGVVASAPLCGAIQQATVRHLGFTDYTMLGALAFS